MCPEGASRLPSLLFFLSVTGGYLRHISVLFRSSGAAPACFHSSDCSRCLFVSVPLLSLSDRAAQRRRENDSFWPCYLQLPASFSSVSKQQTEEIHNVAAVLMMVSFFWNSLPVKGIMTDTRKRQALRISL